jgi:hypothetical protein
MLICMPSQSRLCICSICVYFKHILQNTWNHQNLWNWLEISPMTLVCDIFHVIFAIVDGKKGVLRTNNNEVCTPLTTRCLRAPLLYSTGFVSLARPHQPCLWHDYHRVWREQGLRWFGQKLDSEDGGEPSGRGTPEIHLHVGKAQGHPRSYPSRSLALARGSNEDYGKDCVLLDTSVKIPESLIGVCISTSSLPSTFILLPWLCALLS